MNIIETSALSFSYGKKPILKSIDLLVPQGSIFGFLGPNGAGKSTTIKTLLGLLQVENGMVTLFGKELNRNRIEILSKIGAMVESPSQYEHLSAIRNLEITCRLRNLPLNRMAEVLAVVGLSGDKHRPVRQFSTGMKQRLSLAIALLGEPELLILDEPINGLDPSGIIEIRNLLTMLNNEKGCTIFLSSHILDEIQKICTHVAVISSGLIIYQGPTEGLLERYTEQQKLVVETNDIDRASAILSGKFTSQRSGSGLSISINTREEASAAIRQLVESGLDVYSARRESNDLENSFLEILREGAANE